MRFRWLLAAWLLLTGVMGAAVRYDMTKDELLKELGKPGSVLVKGGREVLTYPNNVRIELEHGKVVSVKGIDIVAAEQAEQAAAVAAEEKVKADAEAKQEAAEKKARDEAEAKAEAKAAKEYAAADAKARAEMEKSITDMENMHSKPALPVPGQAAFNFLNFLIGLFVKWLLMVAALKLTTKYWNADVEWKGLMLAAAADTGVRAVVLFIGEVLLKMFSVFYADEALAAIVLVLVLRKVSTNQSLQQAVTITMTCKVFSVVVGSFLVTILLHALH